MHFIEVLRQCVFEIAATKRTLLKIIFVHAKSELWLNYVEFQRWNLTKIWRIWYLEFAYLFHLNAQWLNLFKQIINEKKKQQPSTHQKLTRNLLNNCWNQFKEQDMVVLVALTNGRNVLSHLKESETLTICHLQKLDSWNLIIFSYKSFSLK